MASDGYNEYPPKVIIDENLLGEQMVASLQDNNPITYRGGAPELYWTERSVAVADAAAKALGMDTVQRKAPGPGQQGERKYLRMGDEAPWVPLT